ncbi:NB-ARC domain-containing protein [Streptomyces sp. NPDC001617]
MGDTVITAIGDSVAAGSIGELHQHWHGAPRAPAALPHQVGVIPSRALSFQHRREADRMRAALADGGTAVLYQVLTGMGGVGKTQLAADYAHHVWDRAEVDLLVWVSAVSRDAIISGYTQAAVEVCGADTHDPELAARVFLAWLRAKRYRWLVVLDDLADPADVRGLWPPEQPLGRTLVTTRRREAALMGSGRRQIQIGLFTPGEAVRYLASTLAAHRRTEPPECLAELAAELGCLPLALSQAAAYLTDQALSIADYCTMLNDRRRSLADAVPDAAGLPDGQTSPVAAVWSLSIDRADRLSPRGLARALLQLAAMLAPNGIPVSVLTSAPALAYLADQRGSTIERKTTDDLDVREACDALTALHRLSLLDRVPGSAPPSVRVHQLVQRATRDALTTERCGQLAQIAADALLASWPSDSGLDVVAEGDMLRANAAALVQHSEGALYTATAHPILRRYAGSLWNSGQIQAALDYQRHLADAAHRRFGPAHPDCLEAQADLAHLTGHMGDKLGAVTTLQSLSGQMRQWLGPCHPLTLNARYLLAHWWGETIGAHRAVTALEQVHADQEHALGPDHEDTLTTRHLLAHWRRKAGDAVGAIADGVQLVADRTRLRGAGHHNTLAARSHLAAARAAAGDERAAVTEYEKILEEELRLFSIDHPNVRDTRKRLASYRWQAGDATGAVTTLAAVLADEERILGPDHAQISHTRSLLEQWLAALHPPKSV